MATGFTDTILNYSGSLYAKSNDQTRLIDAIFARGATMGDGIVGTGLRKVNSIEFALSSGYDVGDGEQPAISESDSTTAPTATQITRDQQGNCVQIFQEAVDVSYLKSSAVGTLAGLNIAGQASNVLNEVDFQTAGKIIKMKKDLNYTFINGVYAKSTGNTVAWKSRGLATGITSNVVDMKGGAFSAIALDSAIKGAFANGFEMSNVELWVNPANLNDINNAYKGETGFGLPLTRSEGGLAITSILTNFGIIQVNYDFNVPADTYFLLKMDELAVAELDTVVNGVNKGTWFYETLSKTGAGEKGQLYAQAGIHYGAEWKHIRMFKGTSA